MDLSSILSIDGIGKVVIPVITFFLGILVTRVTKRADEKRTELRKNIESIVTLTNDWYDQLHNLSVEVKTKPSDRETEKAFYFYHHNRTILPKLQLHLEYVRNTGKAPSLVKATEDFLSVVTTSQVNVKDSQANKQQHVTCKDQFLKTVDMESNQAMLLNNVLTELDQKLQQIIHLSAKALGKTI